MSVTFLASLFALAVVMCFIAGIWLLLHLTALAAMFNGRLDIVASPKPPRVSRGRVIAALAVFLTGLAGIAAVQVFIQTA